jgi:FkbM family methyltransferase
MLASVRDRLNAFRQDLRSKRRKAKLRSEIDPAQVAHLQVTVDCPHAWYGNSYGGFYILPDLLNESSIVYSFGIGKDVSFDRACMRRHRCKVFAFDPTPKAIAWIHRQALPPEFHFHAYGIRPRESGEAAFYLPIDEKSVSGSLVAHEHTAASSPILVPTKSFADITRELGHTHIDVVKLDIEGAEYEVLADIVASPVTIDQILVEFHDRDFGGAEVRSRVTLRTLHDAGYRTFGASAPWEEISLVHRRRLPGG